MFCPASSRVLYVNAAGLIWNAMLSSFNTRAAVVDRQRAILTNAA